MQADREASPELGAVDFLDERDKPKSQVRSWPETVSNTSTAYGDWKA